MKILGLMLLFAIPVSSLPTANPPSTPQPDTLTSRVTFDSSSQAVRFWDQGQSLKIKFLDHRLPSDLEKFMGWSVGSGVVPYHVFKWVKEGFSQWTEPTSLSFEVVTEGNADVRIKLSCESNNRAFRGVVPFDQSEPTVHINPCATGQGIVLHEIGHVLGFGHAQDSPASQAVFTDEFEQARLNDTNFSQPLSHAPYSLTFPDDPESVMYYPIEEGSTEGQFETKGYENNHLSKGDRLMAAFVYPPISGQQKSGGSSLRVPGVYKIFSNIKNLIKPSVSHE